jgi:hypothetical protein
MLTFFRRIRKGLLGSGQARKSASSPVPSETEGKVERYLLYAFGEIALVVIGILIALQINNWNEWRKDRVKEKEYLSEILEDLKRDTVLFSKRLQDTEWKLMSLEMFLSEEIFNLANFKDTSEWLQILFASRGQAYPPINNNAVTDLTSTGNLNIIRNRALKNQILLYHSDHHFNSEILSSKFTTWPNIFSHIVPGKIQSWVRRGMKNISEEDISDFYTNYKEKPDTQLAINAEMGFAQLLFYFFTLSNDSAQSLISEIETEVHKH